MPIVPGPNRAIGGDPTRSLKVKEVAPSPRDRALEFVARLIEAGNSVENNNSSYAYVEVVYEVFKVGEWMERYVGLELLGEARHQFFSSMAFFRDSFIEKQKVEEMLQKANDDEVARRERMKAAIKPGIERALPYLSSIAQCLEFILQQKDAHDNAIIYRSARSAQEQLYLAIYGDEHLTGSRSDEGKVSEGIG